MANLITTVMASQMASQVPAVASQVAQPNLDQERDRWFTTLEAYKRRFEAEKETLKSKLSHDQQTACRDLEEQARYIDAQQLAPPVHELFQKYQAELRTRRLAECQHNYDAALLDLTKHEKELYQQHHMNFPLPTTLLGRNATNAPPKSTPSSANRSQTPATHSQPAQAISQPTRPVNPVANNVSSAPMPTQHAQHTQQPWPAYNHPGPQRGSPHMAASMYQPNRAVNKPAETAPRMLPSNGRAPVLGNGIPIPNPASSASAPPAHGPPASSPHLMNSAVDGARGARVPIPPMSQTPHMSRRPLYLGDQGPEYQRQRQAAEIVERQRQQLKRKSDLSELPSYQEAESKRPRTGTPQSQAPRTIKFQEIYQNGEAEFKHTIVKFEDVFYVLKCDEHGVHFKQNALAAAAKHLHGASHGHLKKEHRLAVQKLGFHVVDCTDELQKLNNDVVAKAFEDGYKPLNQLHGPKSGGKRHSGNDLIPKESPDLSSIASAQPQVAKHQDSKHPDVSNVITNPEAGELYQARWPKSNKLYVVMVLGWTDLSMCGWGEKFCDLALYKERPRPPCFVFNSEGIAGWAKGYGDGEPRVLNREVPVMWFETNGKNRLGWVNVQLLRPFLLDDPKRSENPDVTAKRARQLYAEIRGFNSFEDMLAGKRPQACTEGQGIASAEAPTQMPSSASESDSFHDLDMYDFGDNPPKFDDSDEEDYVEGKERSKDSDDDMADAEPSTPEVRPTSRLGDSGWPQNKSGAAAGTRSSAKKETASVDKEDVAMGDAAQVTPSKTRASAGNKESTPNGGARKDENIPQIALGTPGSPQTARPDKPTENNGNAAETRQSDRAALSELSQGNQSQKAVSQEVSKTAATTTKEPAPEGNGPETSARAVSLSIPTTSANTQQGERSGASKSPSLEKETPRVSPKLQLANLLNDSGSEKPHERPSSTSRPVSSDATKPADTRRPLPTQAGQVDARIATQSAPVRHPLPGKPYSQASARQFGQGAHLPDWASGVEQPAGAGRTTDSTTAPAGTTRAPSNGPQVGGTAERAALSEQLKITANEATTGSNVAVNSQNGDVSKIWTTTNAPRGRESQPMEAPRSASAESASHRPDPRMSISNALGDQAKTPPIWNQAATASNGQNAATNGLSSGNSTPRLLNLALDDRWRAVRASESPRMSPTTMRTPIADRSAAASPVQGLKKDPDGLSIDVASFSEGDKNWARAGSFLHFHIEDERRGVARSKQADGTEATVDAQRVKAAQKVQVDKQRWAVRLVLKAEDGKALEQRLVFDSNTATGSYRGARPQATKFYAWVTSKNEAIEHIE